MIGVFDVQKHESQRQMNHSGARCVPAFLGHLESKRAAKQYWAEAIQSRAHTDGELEGTGQQGLGLISRD